MLALTDSGLAYLVLAAARVPVHARDRWLQRLARQLDSDPRPLTRQGRTGVRLPADDHVRVERAIAAGSESESAT